MASMGATRSWQSVIMHPAKPGTFHQCRFVRQKMDGHEVGEEFTAWYSHGYEWFYILPDANGDGTRELGEKIRTPSQLERVLTNFE